VPTVAGQVNFLQVAYSQTGCLDSDQTISKVWCVTHDL